MVQFDRILFTGGGTGGHLYPGLALAHAIRERNPDCRIQFTGSERPLERRIIRQEGFEHDSLPIQSSAALKSNPFSFVWNYWKSRRQTGYILDKLAPQAVVGLGGFASLPLIRSAQQRRIPTILLEQNTVMGRANAWLKSRADRVCHTYESTIEQKPRDVLTGNPVRHEIAALVARSHESLSDSVHTILILGGSQGSQSVNELWIKAARELSQELASCQIFHQTGEEQIHEIREEYKELGLSAISEPYFEVMPTLYRQTDLAISRSGATTLSELSCASIPAILIPYPNSIGDHQRKNAEYFASRGAAEIVEQNSDALTDTVRSFLAGNLTSYRNAMRSLAHPDATQKVLEVIEELLGSD